MRCHRPTPRTTAEDIRRMLKKGGSAEHAKGVQWFFKEQIKSHGWRTADLRRAAVRCRREIRSQFGPDFVLEVADHLFSGRVLEEKIFAVLMLEKITDEFDHVQFRRFESWLDRINSWADHDALVHYLIAPMIVANPARAQNVFLWAKSQNRWRRRAACVALIQGARQRKFFSEIKHLSGLLLADEDDMVKKGLGWLLRETAKADSRRTVPYLLRIRNCTSRLVLRTACETLSPAARARVLGNL
jgi:3-methyladenine DNA glycosylase AlkD